MHVMTEICAWIKHFSYQYFTQNIAIDTLNEQNLQILEELRDQDVPLTNITCTVTDITKKVSGLDQNDKIIYSTLLQANIGLDQINDTVIKIAEDTLELLQGIISMDDNFLCMILSPQILLMLF